MDERDQTLMADLVGLRPARKAGNKLHEPKEHLMERYGPKLTQVRWLLPRICRNMGPFGRLKFCRGLTIIELLITISIVGVLASIGTPIFGRYMDKARNAKAIADIRNTLETGINLYEFSNNALPVSLADLERGGSILDPWGSTYEYLNFAAAGASWKGKARKDRFLVPLNSAYDLFSKGRDRRSVSPLTSALSQDDIIRANDGAYVGLVSEY